MTQNTIFDTEKSPAGTVRLRIAASTPEETYRQAAALAKTVFPREVGTDAIMRLHGLSHAQALRISESCASRPSVQDIAAAAKLPVGSLSGYATQAEYDHEEA